MNCLFCQIAKHKIPSKIVYEDEEIIAFNDIAPKAPIHILIIPKKHIESVLEIDKNDYSLIGKIIVLAGDIASKKRLSEKGFRLVFNTGKHSGQEIDHIHLHLLGGRKLKSMG